MHPSALYRTSPAAILPWVGIFAALLLAPQITAASIGTALLWWDPLLWLLRRRSRRVLELRCDFGVLRTLDNEGRTDYYDIILQTARMAHAHKGHPHAFRLAAPPIVERFELGLDFARIERQSARYARLLHLAILLCWLLSYMVVFRAGTPLWI